MYILPITRLNNKEYSITSFESKYPKIDSLLNPERIEEQLNKIKESDEASKKIFAGLSALAGTLIAEFAILAQTNDEVKNTANNILKELEIDNISDIKTKFLNFIYGSSSEKDINNPSKEEQLDYSILFKEKPERNTYLAITTKYFPNLSQKYEDMLTTSLKEPENDSNKYTLDVLESIFAVLSQDDGLKYRKKYFEALDKDYVNCLEDVCTNFISTITNGDSAMRYLITLSNGTLQPDEISKWAEAKNLSYDEFMTVRELNKNAIVNIAELYQNHKNFRLKNVSYMHSDSAHERNHFALKLEFTETLPLTEKLKAVTQVHKAIYGPIYLNSHKDSKTEFLETDIQMEMVDNLLKDRRMESIYNFVRYINPDAYNSLDIKPEEVKFLEKDSDKFKQLKKISTDVIMHLNFESPEMKALYDTINDENIWHNIITTRHGKLRFISRMALKTKANENNLKQITSERMNTLKKELDKKLEKINFLCYVHSKGMAPQFYLKDSKLGNYIKITLNSEGTIHTIYEDAKKEQQNMQASDKN